MVVVSFIGIVGGTATTSSGGGGGLSGDDNRGCNMDEKGSSPGVPLRQNCLPQIIPTIEMRIEEINKKSLMN